jgi:carbon monoxide dehydrogenase subunit G
MIRTIRIGLATLAVAVVVIAVVVALQPSDFRVERSITISAPATVVFARVNDLHRWQEFSPWAKLDPAARNTFEGPPAGVGAVFAWAGNDDVGEGRMTISESRPDELVRMKLDFLKPFAATNTTDFTFKPQGERTLVTWSMTGKNNFMAKAVGLLMNMDKLVGSDFEKGLADLKSLSEAEAKS